MTALVVTIFLASLAGSLHCAGMCGAFVALSVGGEPRGAGGHLAVQGAYHGGRLVTYTALGAAAGALGGGLDLTGAVFGAQRIALVVAGAAMIVFGVVALLRLRGLAVRPLGIPPGFRAVLTAGHRYAHGRPPLVRALLIGLLSTFLPCGWLYAFAVTAAGTGSAALGMTTMAVFWLGTLPVLAGVGVGVQKLAGPLRRHVPVATALALVIVGVVAVAGRFDVPALAAAGQVGDGGPVPVETAVDRVKALDAHEMPCCTEAE
jgi:sulfite exporter TauE/SafE